MDKQANQAGPGGIEKAKKSRAKTYAKLRIQKRQKARAGSSGMIDTVKARKTVDAVRYERERKATSGSVEDIAGTQQATQLSSYDVGHRLARGKAISESERIAWERRGISEKAMSEGHNNALRERTTLHVQLVAARTGQTYKQLWRRRKSLAVALIIKRKIERPRDCPDTVCTDALKKWADSLDTSGQVRLYHDVFDCLANP